MSPIFFQNYWHIVGDFVTACVLDILNGGALNQQLNHIHIVLIPKIPKPELITQFRPVSLCNVIYKLVSKTIANRLKPLLDSLISPAQSTFVPGRAITDTVLIAYELNHFLHHKTWDKEGQCSDSRSGTRWEFEGVAISRTAPRVSHLLFTDDTLIFCHATLVELEHVNRMLDQFERASGLKMNLQKSAIVFSHNVEPNNREELAAVLGVHVVDKHAKYLALPTSIGKSKREIGDSIKNRIWGKLNNWAAKKLSQAGRAVLIKTVVQAIPVYTMGCFRIPDSLLAEIESMTAQFFWHGELESRLHWVSWSKVC
ncbi:UNVERIFIED_CONTAM: hypothetical protein Slati_1481000 [Sesamum latifolium]|uniref:Reverse transcriptase domain-containing protein n=1 Tax=Sesamum latifolium TaxID=2727402 RepID=A0AAW2XAP1_9LAMI